MLHALHRPLIALACAGICIGLPGCASRSMVFKPDHPAKDLADLYSRNFVVAAPTFVGNVVCGLPFLLLAVPVSAVPVGAAHRPAWSRFANGLYQVPAVFCGAVLGAPFVPLSYACAERPWDIDFKTIRYMGWQCRAEAAETGEGAATATSITPAPDPARH